LAGHEELNALMDSLLSRVLALPPGERVKLAHELLGSVVADEEGDADEDVDPAFVAELNVAPLMTGRGTPPRTPSTK
ncbi:MAG: hypothetical protein KIT58_21510, partial [Planctomycetota bacterium]|nr:hypothetical protein [Planctomycetota bacterium]